VTPIGGRVKRCLDLLLSLLLLPIAAILTLPIVLLIAVNGRKPIYRHLRVGWNGRPFRCYKLRTMIADADAALENLLRQDQAAHSAWLQHYKLENDPRVTRLGWFLRRTNLDEVPQIWNVLRGEMSWVGPRPVIPEELSKYGPNLASYLACRPGITGLWQINRHSDTPYSVRVGLDAEYARNWSIARDIGILLVTIPRIVAANSRTHRAAKS
jgi:lipopolysaccharide/colanic/teichoic acid biosynthesis glycosyltransferase